MTIKYFYVEDDSAVLFGANGTALTLLLVGIKDIVPMAKFSIPTDPLWLYFMGLIFAFLSKGMIQLLNDDTLQREKLQNMRDILTTAKNVPDLDKEISSQIDNNWKIMDVRYKSLFSPNNVLRIGKLRAIFFFASVVCFLIATSRLIHFASILLE
jgi:hypothetical protein